MTIYTEVFGGANIYPSEITYSSTTLSSDIFLSWPEETSTDENLATKIMDVTPTGAGFSIYLPSAAKSGTGNTILFTNLGTDTFTVKNAEGTQVVSIASGLSWQVYLTNNDSVAGSWRALQYGASVSQANASSLAGTGIVAVGTLLSQSVPVTTFSTNYTCGALDRAKMFNWIGAAGTLALPDSAAIGNNWFVYVRNSGSGQLTVDAPGLTFIDGNSYLGFQPGESAIVASDGSNFYTIGFGQSATFAFDYTVISVAGSGDYILSGSELNRVAYRFTGLLTGDRAIVVPSTVQQYWVDNRTTGDYILSVIPYGGGLGVNIAQGERSILYCDGTDVLNADTASASLPLAVDQGGTGAVTASQALINLGGTSVGTAVFTAANQLAALSDLGGGSAGILTFVSETTNDIWALLGPAQSGNVDGGVF